METSFCNEYCKSTLTLNFPKCNSFPDTCTKLVLQKSSVGMNDLSEDLTGIHLIKCNKCADIEIIRVGGLQNQKKVKCRN